MFEHQTDALTANNAANNTQRGDEYAANLAEAQQVRCLGLSIFPHTGCSPNVVRAETLLWLWMRHGLPRIPR